MVHALSWKRRLRTWIRRTGTVPGLADTAPAAERLQLAVADRYGIERELGRGGMAAVYLARDLRHERQVAIKVLRPELAALVGRERFLREIRVTAQLQHPHIITLIDSGEAGGLLYYVMPYVEGESLRHRLDGEPRLDVEEAVRLVRGVAGALDYAHRQGVVHRDIKPENILLADGQPIVMDFGIARALHTAANELAASSRMTATGSVIGTPAYMSPEQLIGEGPIDARSDLYSLGCVLYEMLAGAAPFSGASADEVLAKRLLPYPPALRERNAALPRWLTDCVERAMQPAPSRRFQSAAEFAEALAPRASEAAPAGAAPARSDAARPPAPATVSMSAAEPAPAQEIQFCSAQDGVKLAYAIAGSGPPLVKAANWLSHLEYDWQSPMWRHWLTGLAAHFRFVRYDERGCGLSDWNIGEVAFEDFVDDLEAVVDAAGLERFALLGVSQGGAIAIAYTIRHPEKVSHLILHGAYACGRGVRARTPREVEEARMQIDLVRVGWGHDEPSYRQIFTTQFFPEATPEQARSFTELQQISAPAHNAAAILSCMHGVDVRDLAPRLRVPTLVLHSQQEVRVPFEEGRLLASLIPGARLVPLQSRNHIPLADEPAWAQFLSTVRSFLAETS
jgi:pimeloyl-ACP methyl ester carboxylesterase